MTISFVEIPTEQSTAVSDIVLAIIAFSAVFYVIHIGQRDMWKAIIWACIFGLIAIAAILGGMAHGILMPSKWNDIFWQVIYLALGITIALIGVAVIYDLFGIRIAKMFLPAALFVGVVFFVATLYISGGFLMFIIYEIMVMAFVLLAYISLLLRKEAKGSGSMATGILITIIAAGIQSTGEIHMVLFNWEFDHNGVFHLVQIFGLLFLVFGLKSSLSNNSLREV